MRRSASSVRRAATAALVTGALVLTACGSDDGTTGADTATDTSAETATDAAATEATDAVDDAPGDTEAGDTEAMSDATTAPATDAPATGTDAAPVEVPEALQFSAALVGGGELDLATLAGRPVLLWFWAPF